MLDKRGAIIAVVATVIGSIVTAVGTPIVESIIQSSANVKAEISYSGFELPPHLAEEQSFDELFSQNNGIIFATITNTGNKPANAVEILLPTSKIAKFTKDEQVIISTGSIVSIGYLRPKEKVSITAWSNFPLLKYSLQNATLTHSEGIGSIKIEQKFMAGPFMLFLKRNLPFVTMMTTLLITIIIFLVAEAHKRRSAKEN